MKSRDYIKQHQKLFERKQSLLQEERKLINQAISYIESIISNKGVVKFQSPIEIKNISNNTNVTIDKLEFSHYYKNVKIGWGYLQTQDCFVFLSEMSFYSLYLIIKELESQNL